jgi:hypothetical protein
MEPNNLVGQCVRNDIYGEGMTRNILSLNKIINIDDNFITFINVQMKMENNRWICSEVLGKEKIKLKLNYPKTTSKNKKDKVKLHQQAIDNLNLRIYKNDAYFPEWTNEDRTNYFSDFEIYKNYVQTNNASKK